jgi:Leucine-rich repeat (LRR) protein
LTKVPDIIGQCLQLEKLDISFTDITEIPDFVFQLPKLKELSYLHCASLQRQPTGFSSHQPLEKLSISIGKNQAIPSEIAHLKGLKTLVLGGDITEIPPFIYTLTKLENLEIFDTKVSTLSATVSQLTKLKKVLFWQALFSDDSVPTVLNLTEIFSHLSNCKQLKAVHLDSNGITEIPENVALLSQIEVFYAKENKLTAYPKGLHALKNLKELDLSVNQLKEIPTGIGNLAQLRTLRLNANWTNQIDTTHLFNEIAQLTNLETLILSHCRSVKAIPEAIAELKKLKSLDLENNFIETLPKSIFTMTQLKHLGISMNKIGEDEMSELQKRFKTT